MPFQNLCARRRCGDDRLVWLRDALLTEDVRKYAAEQGIAEEEALKKGREEKSREFTEKGSELYAKA